MRLRDVPAHTIITAVTGVAWLGSFVARAVKPDFALGGAADALMTTVVGYWFTANHMEGEDDGGLMREVVTKVGMPMIATAHESPSPGPQQGHPAPGSPTPAPAPYSPSSRPHTPPPYTPSPAPRPTQPGGLPWSS